MIAVDDGLWSGNLNAADIFFIIATVLLFVAAVLAIPQPTPHRAGGYASTVAFLGLACVAFGFLIL